MRHTRGSYARGGAVAGALLVGLGAATAFAADGTLKLEQDDPSVAANREFNGNVGGGEFGVYDFVNNNAGLTLLPISATAKVNAIVTGGFHGPFDFQTFCLEPGVHVDFNVDLDWTANNQVQKIDGTFRNLDPRTAYLFWQFWNGNALSPAYNYTLGTGRSSSAGTLQLAIWFTEGVSGFNAGDVKSYTDDAAAAVASGGSWFVFTGGQGFPGNLGGVRALNIVHNGALQQDILAIFTTEPPPPPPSGDCEGRTPGFWHNKNGQALIKESGAGADWTWLNTLNALCLRNQAGNDVDFTINKDGGKDLANFLTSGNNAVNMAQKLSQHVAAMQLNILNGFADDDCLLYTGGNAACIPGSPSTVSVGDVMDLAKDQLCDHPLTTEANDPDNRKIQECLKNIIESGNTNVGWVH